MTLPIILIMAGGLGKRMCSDLPKVLHLVQGKPMLVHVIESSWKLSPQKIIIIVGKYRSIIEQTLRDRLNTKIFDQLEFAIQQEANGTGNAIKCALSNLIDYSNNEIPTLILSGDTPLVTTQTMKLLLQDFSNARIMTTQLEDPSGYGRVIINNNKFQKIVEHKDCNNKQLLIKHINTGIYSVSLKLLKEYIPKINNNNSQQEYYLTDLFSLLQYNNIPIQVYEMPIKDQLQLTGINTKDQLDQLNKLLEVNFLRQI